MAMIDDKLVLFSKADIQELIENKAKELTPEETLELMTQAADQIKSENPDIEKLDKLTRLSLLWRAGYIQGYTMALVGILAYHDDIRRQLETLPDGLEEMEELNIPQVLEDLNLND